MSDAVLKEQKDRVAILTIDKPKMNQLSAEVFETMRKHLDAIEMDKTILAVIITGSGDKAFSAGADLSAGFGDFSAVDFLKRGQDVWNKVEYFPEARHRRNKRPCAGRRMRARHGLPLPLHEKRRPYRPHRDEPGDHARIRRKPAAAAPRRQVQGA